MWIFLLIFSCFVSPTFESIKNQVKTLYKYEKYKYTLCDREDKFEQRWGILLDYFEE